MNEARDNAEYVRIPSGFTADEIRLLRRFNQEAEFHAAVAIYQRVTGWRENPEKTALNTLRQVEALEKAWGEIDFPAHIARSGADQ